MTYQLATNRTFGVEFEAYNVDRYTLVNELRAANIDAQAASYSGQNFSVWQIKTDCSIRGINGFEIVSPVLRGEAGLREVEKVLEITNRLGGQVNRSCGFHIHWGVGDWGVKQFRNFCKRWSKFEGGLDTVQPPSRRGDANTFCRNFRTAFQYIDQCRTIDQLINNVQQSRYKKINFQKFWNTGTVEVRHHAGTLDWEKTLHWIKLTASLVADADNGKSIQKWNNIVTGKKMLDTLLDAAVRTGGIDNETRKFFKGRARHFVRMEEQERNN